MTEEERRAAAKRDFERLLEWAPDRYRVLGQGEVGWDLLPEHLERHLSLRSQTLAKARHEGFTTVELAALLLEMSAALFAPSLDWETFERNARLWYDSARAIPEAGPAQNVLDKGDC